MKKNQKNKNIKKAGGPILAILVFLVIICLGFILGKYISYEYNKRNNTSKGILEILKIEKTNKPINYILTDGPKTVKELCGKDTGLCNEVVGTLTLDKTDVNLLIYANFDNPDELATNYFKIGERKIGSFVYIDRMEILANKYLIVTEPNSKNDNYIIHIYNYKGVELMSYDATDQNSSYEIKDNDLYFYYCDLEDSELGESETLYNFSRYKVSASNVLKKIVDASEYQKCV